MRVDSPPPTPDIGLLGETLVAHWLRSQGWSLQHHRWRCRWGEIDLIAQQPGHVTGQVRSLNASLVFIEVKTRKQQNWDADGLLAVTPQKQAKLWQAAELFLASEPQLATLPCRFDLALVAWQPLKTTRSPLESHASQAQSFALEPFLQVHSSTPPAIALGQPVVIANHQLVLKDYLQNVID